jgi:hypothetical protein
MPETPKPETQTPFQAFQNPAVWIAMMASAFTRAPMTAALNAGAAAMKGFREGDKQKREEAYQDWKASTEKALNQNQVELERYKAAADAGRGNIQAAQAALQAEAASFKNDSLAALVRGGYVKEWGEWIQHMETMQAKAREAQARIQDKHDARQQQEQRQEEIKRHNLATEQGKAAGMSDDTAKFLAEEYIAGNKSALTGMGRSAQGGQNVMKVREAITEVAKERGMSGADIAKLQQQYAGDTSYQRTAGTQGARVESAANEVAQLVPQAIETSRALPRGKWVPWNELQQKYQQGMSDPAFNDFTLANFSLINAYTRAMNPSGVPRVQERLEQHANGILSTATSPQAYEVQVRRLIKEVEASKRATVQTREGRTDPGTLENIIHPEKPRGKSQGSDDGWKIEEVQ